MNQTLRLKYPWRRAVNRVEPAEKYGIAVLTCAWLRHISRQPALPLDAQPPVHMCTAASALPASWLFRLTFIAVFWTSMVEIAAST